MSGDVRVQPKLVGIAARCVMVTPVGQAPDAELREALNRPDLQVISTDNVYVALAELCAACRHDVGRLKTGSRGEGLILLLAYPERLVDPAALVHSVERYAPHTAVWMFDPAGSPRLRAAKVEDLAQWDRNAGQAAAAEAPPPELRPAPRGFPGRSEAISKLSGAVRPAEVEPRRESGKDRQDGGLLSEEELAMLLAVDTPGVHNEHDRPS